MSVCCLSIPVIASHFQALLWLPCLTSKYGYPMIITNEKIGHVLAVSVAGQVNSANAAGLEAQLLALVENGECNWVLDLSRLDYISSAGLRVVLMLAKRVREQQGQLILCCLQQHVREVFDISGFLAILTVTDTRDEAVAQISH